MSTRFILPIPRMPWDRIAWFAARGYTIDDALTECSEVCKVYVVDPDPLTQMQIDGIITDLKTLDDPVQG